MLEPPGLVLSRGPERTMTVEQANPFMVGVQANLVLVILGVVGVTLDLSCGRRPWPR
ncbi:hypothetical protein [Amycolatopsis pithecellobii]|uniref:Uncharacterized protein n=1 Tax=Amycolatopsis pithecellobii TaxID=664692 RepID=A0A6N7Z6Q2_9PSEU|nr:hypothetical protein [Amycolatopsis pithecellobii]MTD56510.1 hypothetical protein [Amycolatopsis pithecellobii]